MFLVISSGDNDLPGLTDIEKPRMRGPKRATKIRKLFNLTKEDDVRKYVNTYRRSFVSATGTFALLSRSIRDCSQLSSSENAGLLFALFLETDVSVCRQEEEQGTQDPEACDSVDIAEEASQSGSQEAEGCQGQDGSGRIPEAFGSSHQGTARAPQ